MSSFNISRFTSMSSRPKYTFKKVTSSKINFIDENEEDRTKAVGDNVERDSFNDTVDMIEQKYEGSTFILGQIISQNELALAQSNTKYDIFDEFLELGIRNKSVNKIKNDGKIKKRRGVGVDNNNTIVASDKNSKKQEIENDDVKNRVLQKNKDLEKDEKRVDFKIYDDISELIINSATEPGELQEQDYLNDTHISEDWRDMNPIMTSTPVKVTIDSQYHTNNVSSTSLEEIGNILPSDDDEEDKESLKIPQTVDFRKKIEKQLIGSLESKGDQNKQENLVYDLSPDPLTLPMRLEDQKLPPPPKRGYQIIKKILDRPLTPTSEVDELSAAYYM
ncbi:20285_t:CDS:2 [Gigaspora margarita]|uniref:20285_t:CDS:1 n=1 Tax=Gigaspora margarita TaxID=4874 RepID=A0ABN7W894_GIGMA|nr:20285_t:CDS:2 [Gigaspora margarita]